MLVVDWLESRPYKNLGAEDGSGCGGGLRYSFFGGGSREAFRLLLLTLIFLAGLSRDPRELSVSVLYSLFFWYRVSLLLFRIIMCLFIVIL